MGEIADITGHSYYYHTVGKTQFMKDRERGYVPTPEPITQSLNFESTGEPEKNPEPSRYDYSYEITSELKGRRRNAVPGKVRPKWRDNYLEKRRAQRQASRKTK